MSQATTMQCMEVWGGNQLVDTSVTMPGLNAWLYSKPYGQSDGGGDVHYVSSCATGRVARLLVADVSGHGARACNVAGTLRTLMRKYVNFIDQGEFVRSMNRQFVTLSAADCFATAIVTTFFAPTNSLYLCNAGHPPPLLYRAAQRRWEVLELAIDDQRPEDAEPANIPLGVEDVAEYEQFEVTLDLGDLVLCYTDSLIEARSAPDGDLLGTDGLLETVRTLDASRPASLTPALLNAVAAKAPGNLDADDVTVLLFSPSTSHRSTPVRDRLMAPVRVARGILASLLPGGGPAPMPEFTLQNIGGSMLDTFSRLRRSGKGRG